MASLDRNLASTPRLLGIAERIEDQLVIRISWPIGRATIEETKRLAEQLIDGMFPTQAGEIQRSDAHEWFGAVSGAGALQ